MLAQPSVHSRNEFALTFLMNGFAPPLSKRPVDRDEGSERSSFGLAEGEGVDEVSDVIP